jgi:hypothetical protein
MPWHCDLARHDCKEECVGMPRAVDGREALPSRIVPMIEVPISELHVSVVGSNDGAFGMIDHLEGTASGSPGIL